MDNGSHSVQSDAHEGEDWGRAFLLFPKELASDGGEEEADDDEVGRPQDRVAREGFGENPQVGGKQREQNPGLKKSLKNIRGKGLPGHMRAKTGWRLDCGTKRCERGLKQPCTPA